MSGHQMTRRQMLKGSCCGVAALSSLPSAQTLLAATKGGSTPSKFKIGACDWSLGQRQRPEVFQVAATIGLDGVQVSFSEPGSDFDLRESRVRDQYQKTAREHGVAISSLAMGIFNKIPYASDPRTEQWVADVIEVMPKLNVKNCLLAFFSKGDLQGDRAAQDEVIRRLKRVAPKAEKAGVVLGVESTLNAADHIRIVDSVASPSVKVYYDVANMHYAGYDICKEIRQLGCERICEFHMKERGHLLGDGEINFHRVKDAIDDIGYTGWLIIEGATVKGKSRTDCYKQNQRFLRSVFLPSA